MKKSVSVVMSLLFLSAVSVFLISTPAYATNGMNLEGYGPIATGMGGASMAYDNGAAAVMNNPATLGLMPVGNRLDVALGFLGPHVTASAPGAPEAKSSADAFYMPALGWIQKSGQMSYGLGLFAQGGMGAEYSKDSFLAYGSGDKVRSELGVGRVILPLAYNVNKELSIAATVDYVWATLDLKLALNPVQFADLVGPSFGGNQTYGFVRGPIVDTLGGAFGAGQLTSLNWARFDFSDSSSVTGKAKGEGFAGKIGGVYTINDAVSVGLAYHSKTSLGDLKTNGGTVSMEVAGPGLPGGGPATIAVTGKYQIEDFQWPQTAGAGIAYKATPELLIVFDYKWINWADVMKDFKVTFTADAAQADPLAAGFGLGGQSLNAALYQQWEDQHVLILGAAYKVSPEWTVRGGINYANNPIPDTYLNSLFPAIEKTHVTVGAGYMISKASSVDASFTYAPEVKATSGPNAPEGATVAHYQTNAQVMYSYRF